MKIFVSYHNTMVGIKFRTFVLLFVTKLSYQQIGWPPSPSPLKNASMLKLVFFPPSMQIHSPSQRVTELVTSIDGHDTTSSATHALVKYVYNAPISWHGTGVEVCCRTQRCVSGLPSGSSREGQGNKRDGNII